MTHRDDVLQETLLQAWSRWSDYDGQRGSPRAWLMAILIDRCRRHRRRWRVLAQLPAADLPGPARPHRDLVLEKAITTLSRRQRQVVTLHYLADLSVADVAVVLGVTVGAVKSYLHDARSSLRAELGDADES